MLISRTPYRISFFGGGTDYPAWYEKNGGVVLSTTIDKYSYITCKKLPPFFDYKFRIRYYKREEVNFIEDIEHPSIRESLKYFNIPHGMDIVHHGDLPAQSGLGSSSTFTVGLLHALHAMQNHSPSKSDLAKLAIYIEQEKIGEHVGSQDQVAASYGGLNRIEFLGKNEINVSPLSISSEMLSGLEESMLLFFTGFTRNAATYAKDQIEKVELNSKKLLLMKSVVEYAEELLMGGISGLKSFGHLLDEQWKIKKSLDQNISTGQIDEIYAAGIKVGAWGGKLLGAGGGGFMLFMAPPEAHLAIRAALSKYLYVPVKLDFEGSRVIYQAPNSDFV
jgi:D-glycero-alpha-D-manno-heptose-7-phosphate kinase